MTHDDLDAGARDRLLDRLQASLVEQAGAAPLRRVDRAGPLPASFAQLRLWFLDRLAGGTVAYNLPVAVRLRGPLDPGVLQRSLDEVVRRHEILRTTLVERDGEPYQSICPAAGWPLERDDLSALGDEQQRAETAARLRRSAWAPFDLSGGPLVRALLLRLADDEHVLGLTLHHAVADGWSVGVLFGELDACYAALAGGRSPELPELDVQYADFAAWQRETLSAQRRTDDVAYWRARLDGAPPVLRLPTDRSPERGEPWAGDLVRARVRPPVAAALRDLAGATGTTTFMLLAAAFGLALGRYAGSDDVVLGCPVAGRSRPETAGLIGMFLNTVPLRFDLAGAATFRDLLQRVRGVTLEAYAHQELPFEQLVEALQPERALAHTPVFQVLVNHTSTVPLARRMGPLELEFLEPVRPAAKLPLSLYSSDDDGLELTLVHQTGVLSRRRAATILDALTGLLEQVAADADRSPAGYSLVTPAAAAALPDLAWPLPAVERPDAARMFDRWTELTPAAPALEWRGDTVTYAALGVHVRHVRTRLARAGVVPGERVAVTGEACPGLVASLLAVLSAGAVAVLLDPGLPRQRLAAMASEGQVGTVVLAGLAEADAPFPLRDLRVVEVPDAAVAGGEAADGAAVDGPPGAAAPAPGDAAYVFFTSGTTGRPKGVLGGHRGLSHFLSWQRDTFAVGPGDRCAHLTALSFDVVLRDLLLPLVSGATLVLPDGGLAADRVLGWLAATGATVAHAVPTLASAWLAASPGARVGTLRRTFFAGEPLTGEVVRGWREACPATTVVNLYGPTETTLAKVFHVVGDEPAEGAQPVGQALPGAQVLPLTPAGAPCGVAEPGEVVIRTPYRTLGYLDPQAGEGRFVVNPQTGDPDDLLYRTGDLGRVREDGAIELLGRSDRQVKIRGVRIEPDEVAAVLSGHPAVSRAVAAADDGATALVAWAVVADGGAATPAQLRGYLAKRLPSAMVPSRIGIVSDIPATPNGKVDWAALHALHAAAPREAAYEPPQGATEVALARAWAELLGVPRVGREDDFFGLGGHSLLAMQLVARLGDAFGVTVALHTVFQNPLLRDQAAAVDRERATAVPAAAPLPAIVPVDRAGGAAVVGAGDGA